MIGHAGQAFGVFVLVMALALWAAADGGVPVSARVDAPPAASASVALSKSLAIMQACRNGAACSHSICMSAAVCASQCTHNAAIIPVVLDVSTPPRSCADLTTNAKIEDHRLLPDPPHS